MSFPRIDMVFTYVDGTDPDYAGLRAQRYGAPADTASDIHETAIRFQNVGEIAFAVRSVLGAMPWIGTIHIVTDGQKPPVDRGLIESGRVRVVDHSEIVPRQYRPVFASTIIESFLFRIPDLSDIWLYNNDDFLLGGAISPAEFCAPTHEDGLECRLRLRTVPGRVRVALRRFFELSPGLLPRANAYTSGIANSARLLRQRLGFPWRDIVFPRHLTQVYRTQTAQEVEKTFADELHEARQLHFRSPAQLSWSTLAYSLECHRHGAHQRRHNPFAASRRRDELFVDFAVIRDPARLERAWRRIEISPARFMCLNNIPVSQRTAFEKAMSGRGLGQPVADGDGPETD
jgi:hypothetical protein